jgi:hypothetical protein
MALSTRFEAASPYRRVEEDFFLREDRVDEADFLDDEDLRLEARLLLALLRELLLRGDFRAAIDPPG